ncbi:SNF1-interacting protein [Coniosporium apollinis]|uniref:SNF1-interacting protein n=1 Tax=Coniosporium apollinis TaxID=61459 RepID=A0ABQ9P5W4_9PEZI|nr:SNF1-interacting protein [Coniosporium apollinis]
MAEEQPALTPVGKPLSLIPVGLKEAALDSPTFRATAVHFGEQIDIIEKWLDGYVKSASKLAQEVSTLDSLVNNFLAQSTPPSQVSEAVIDHDYTILAMKRYGDGARDYWSNTFKGIKSIEKTMVEPIRAFLQNDLKNLKDARKTLDSLQKNYDSLVARFSGQAKSKDPSSIREDAFQLHEARKSYLKASMDFCVLAPQVRASLNKMLVKVFYDRWREMKQSRDLVAGALAKWGNEIERIRGWSREMENGERVFKRELQMARKQIEDSAEHAARPSRELEDYSSSTIPFIGAQAPSSNLPSPAKLGGEKSEKQGWLFQREYTGKPTRTVWRRRWFFVKNGIFGWLAQGARSGAVEESEKFGVLLCSIRPAFQEERRFCFEVKTKDTTFLLQAETQAELTEWISAFEAAKRKALEDPASTEASGGDSHALDAAFAISPPVAPEFAAKTEGHASHLSDELHAPDRAVTLAMGESFPRRGSFDASRRGTGVEESGRDHATRIIQKLDLHRRSTASPQLSGNSTPTPASAGGIATLISASHGTMIHGTLVPSVSPITTQVLNVDPVKPAPREIPTSSLAPSTLVNPPSATNLSKAAVVLSSERGLRLGATDGGMPGGLMANLWGSTNWGYINRLERGEVREPHRLRSISTPPSPTHAASPSLTPIGGDATHDAEEDPTSARATSPAPRHRKTISLGTATPRLQSPAKGHDEFPNYYPLPLKAQDAQFRILFPNVPRREKVVLVFRATWNPNDQQEFPGRVYVTVSNIYFYSNHFGLILITGTSLSSIEEVTAAPGRDCDFLYLHLQQSARKDNFNRITIKIFLEPLKLLQRRLSFLVRNCNSETPLPLEEVLKTLIKLEANTRSESPSGESWEDTNADTPVDGASERRVNDFRSGLRIDGELYARPGAQRAVSRNALKFKLPSHPVKYAPQGMTRLAVEKEFNISAKALFHVMFGDKSALFQMLYRERSAQRIVQSPWVQPENGHHRREFEYEIEYSDSLGKHQLHGLDYQIIEVFNDHLCYVVTDRKTPWYFPLSKVFVLTTRIVITHVSKSRCKLAIYTKVDWVKQPFLIRGLIERQALRDLNHDALDLTDLVEDQVHKLGNASRTQKAIQIFGQLGQQTQATQLSASDIPPPIRERRFKLKIRTVSSLFLDAILVMLSNALATALGSLSAFVGGILKACTAHTMLLALLVLSVGFNSFHSYRDTWGWWSERNAGKFMARIGVHPNAQMSRAVYLADIDEVLTNTTTFAEDGSGNQCLATFLHLLTQTDPDASFASTTPSLSPTAPSTHRTSHRLHRTRQSLGAYRHDLLVALRVVNSVEREVLRAEYENWVLDEGMRCRKLEGMLGGRGNGTEVGEAAEWVREYCGDCGREVERVRGGEWVRG